MNAPGHPQIGAVKTMNAQTSSSQDIRIMGMMRFRCHGKNAQHRLYLWVALGIVNIENLAVVAESCELRFDYQRSAGNARSKLAWSQFLMGGEGVDREAEFQSLATRGNDLPVPSK
jgi:hypothetical protein